MNRRLMKMTLVFLALSLVLGGLNLYISSTEKLPLIPESLTLIGKAPTDIDRLDINNQHGRYSVFYDEANGGYVIGDLPADLIDLDRFVSFMVAVSELTASSKAADKVADEAAYGLDMLGADVALTFTDGQTIRLKIGKQETVSGNYYLSLEGKEGLYTLNQTLSETLLSGQDSFLSLQVTPPLTVSSPLSAIKDASFKGKAFFAPFDIKAVSGADSETKLKALSFGTATHLLTLKGTHALDQEGGIRLMGSLLDIKAIRVMDYDLNEEKLAKYGFDTPDARVDFVLAGSGQAIGLSLAQAEGSTFYLKEDSKDAVYLVNRPAFLDMKPEQLVLRYIANPMLLDIKGLSIITPENTYDIAYERPTGTEGEARVNGETVPVAHFHAFYRLLTSAASDGSLYTGEAPTGEPALSIIYRYKNENKPEDVLAFYPLEARRMAVSVNGVSELVIRDSFVARVIEAAEDLKNGESIEEVW